MSEAKRRRQAKAKARRHSGRVERVIRFPAPLYGRLKERAELESRSANAEVIVAIEEHLEDLP